MSERYTDIKMSMYVAKATQFPCLKGKAGKVKRLAVPLKIVCDRLLTNDNERHVLIKKMLKCIVFIEETFESQKGQHHFSDDVASAMKTSIYGFVQINTLLGHFFHNRGVFLFNFTIKFHYALHIANLCSAYNPAIAWCYQGEDMMRIIRNIIESSVSGTPTEILANRVMVKYANGLGMHMHINRWR